MKKFVCIIGVLVALVSPTFALMDSRDYSLTVTTNGSSAEQAFALRGEVYGVNVTAIPAGSPTGTMTFTSAEGTIFTKTVTEVGFLPLTQPLYKSNGALATTDATNSIWGSYFVAGSVTGKVVSASTNSGTYRVRFIYNR
jgi:hypothetical protein